MKKGDIVAGSLLIGLGIFIIQQALQLDYVNEFGPGPGFLPLWLGVGFLALASSLVVTAILRPKSQVAEKDSWKEIRRAVATWGGLVVATALLSRLGLILSFALLTGFLVLVMSRRSPLTALTIAAGGALSFYLIFAVLLGLRLPLGPWGF